MKECASQHYAILALAEVIGEAIARAHLAGKKADTINANATVLDGRGGCGSVGLTKGDSNDDHFTTKTKITSICD